MGKIDIEFRSKCSERTVGCIEQGICGAIIRRSEPFALEEEEKDIVNQLAETLQIPEQTAISIIEVLIIKNKV